MGYIIITRNPRASGALKVSSLSFLRCSSSATCTRPAGCSARFGAEYSASEPFGGFEGTAEGNETLPRIGFRTSMRKPVVKIYRQSAREKRDPEKKKRERENLSDRESERGKRAREIESSTESSRELEERARDLRKARSSSTPRELGRETPIRETLATCAAALRKAIGSAKNEHIAAPCAWRFFWAHLSSYPDEHFFACIFIVPFATPCARGQGRSAPFRN